LLLIDYDQLIADPQPQLAKIAEFLELPQHLYDINNIVNDTSDDDLVAWGFDGMHKIRPRLEKTSRPPQEILGVELYNRFIELERQYQ
jgi:hypothetical protein